MGLEARIPPIVTIFVCYSKPSFGLSGFWHKKYQFFLWTSVKTFSMHTVVHHGLSHPFGGSNEPRSVHAPHFDNFRIAHHFLGDPDSDVKNAKFFRGRPSRPYLWIRLAITDCLAHLEGQTSPEASIRLILTIFVCYSTPFFRWSRLRRQKCQIFSWTSVKTLSMHTVCHHGLSDLFGGSNEPRSEHTPHFNDFRVL